MLQCLVLDGKDSPNSVEMATILIDAGADLNGPLLACASCDNVDVAALNAHQLRHTFQRGLTSFASIPLRV